jgi:hypothetical protein
MVAFFILETVNEIMETLLKNIAIALPLTLLIDKIS